MDQSLEVINVKNEPTETTRSDRLEIKTETHVEQENCYLIHSEFDVNTDPQEVQSDFSRTANISNDLCPNYDMKIEMDEPIIKIEYENVLDEILQDPLDVGDEIKVEKHFSVDLEKGEAKIKTEPTEEEQDENLLESDENIESHRSASNFQVQELIRNDAVSDNKKYICNECDKAFRWKSALDRHLRIHTGIKPYTCNVCKKSFTQKQHLDRHMLIHSGERPHSCDVCRKVFSQKSHLDSHKLMHSRVKSFSCKICKKEFSQKGTLDGHMLIHSGVKQFSCDVCKKSFARKHELVKHKRIHTGEKPYTCNMCDRTFIQKSDLTKHTRTHTGEKPFSCDICNKSFARKEILNQHKRIHNK